MLLSLETQTVVFQLFDFHLRKFKKFIIKKFYFHNLVQTFNLTLASWRFTKRTVGQARIPGEGALEGSLGVGEPPWPSNPDPV